jgi:hypothetical protein
MSETHLAVDLARKGFLGGASQSRHGHSVHAFFDGKHRVWLWPFLGLFFTVVAVTNNNSILQVVWLGIWLIVE